MKEEKLVYSEVQKNSRRNTTQHFFKSLKNRLRENQFDTNAWIQLSQHYKSNRELERARNTLIKAIQLNDQTAELFKELADIYRAQGLVSEAKKSYLNAIELDAYYFQAHANLSNILLDMGQIDEAVYHAEKAANIRPDIAELFNNFGNALRIARKPSQAITQFQKALSIKPNLISAELNLGLGQLDLNDPRRALPHLETVLRAAPELPENLAALIICMRKLNRPLAARTYAIQLEKIRPNNVQTDLAIGEFFIDCGDYQAAEKRLEPYRKLIIKNFDVAQVFASLALKSGTNLSIVQDLKQLTQTKLSTYQQRTIYYLIGELHHQSENYQSAFANFQRADKLKTGKFNRRKYSSRGEEAAASFSKKNLKNLPRSTNTSSCPILILGTSRSGKSLVEQILTTQPEIIGLNERNIFSHVIKTLEDLTQRRYPDLIPFLTTETLDKVADEFLSISESRNAQHVISTLPDNIYYAGLFSLLFPKAHIIEINRNPLDTALSCFFRNYKASNYANSDLLDHGYIYAATRRLLEHWDKTLNTNILHLQYEDIVRSTESNVLRITRYLGLEYNNSFLLFHKPGKSQINSNRATTTPLSEKHIGIWEKYYPFIQQLIQQQKEYGHI
jgi:tetratricopeptide (TPR) repeat protein